MSNLKIMIRDMETGRVFEFGKDRHDALVISNDGKSLYYYNLQCGDGSFGDGFEFYYPQNEDKQYDFYDRMIHNKDFEFEDLLNHATAFLEAKLKQVEKNYDDLYKSYKEVCNQNIEYEKENALLKSSEKCLAERLKRGVENE